MSFIRRRHLAACLAWMAMLSACSMCQAKPGETNAADNKPANSKGPSPEGGKVGSEGSKSLASPLGSSPVALGKSTNIDVSKPYGYHLEPILKKIKANNDQRTKIVVVVQSYRSKIQPLRDEYKVKRQEFITVMTGGGTAETIMAKQMELSHLASEITSKYTLMRLEVRRLLSPEQILLFEEYAREHGWNSR